MGRCEMADDTKYSTLELGIEVLCTCISCAIFCGVPGTSYIQEHVSLSASLSACTCLELYNVRAIHSTATGCHVHCCWLQTNGQRHTLLEISWSHTLSEVCKFGMLQPCGKSCQEESWKLNICGCTIAAGFAASAWEDDATVAICKADPQPRWKSGNKVKIALFGCLKPFDPSGRLQNRSKKAF